MTQDRLGLFEAFGIELELMIVDSTTLNVLPICDQLLTAAAGELTGEVEFGPISWSNELALHVLELKVTEPVSNLSTMAGLFQQSVQHANQLLTQWNARLMPSAMHPWMNPDREMVLWPHDYSPVYSAFDRIFNCKGHGWANLQSTHWNFPFADDAEFAKLHAAIRVILPLLPALTASSPIYDGRLGGSLDSRLDVYRRNSAIIPSIAGRVVPEPVYSEADYEREIYQVMYRDIAPHDPAGILQHIWLNARGAIARFDRGAIEIRVLDNQECPAADLALGRLIAAALAALVDGRWSATVEQSQLDTEMLASVLWDVVKSGFKAQVPEPLSAMFGIRGSCTARDIWSKVMHDQPNELRQVWGLYLEHGNLAERILKSLAGDLTHENLQRVYGQLCDCLQQGTFFGLDVPR